MWDVDPVFSDFLIVQKKLLKIISPQTVLDDFEEGKNTKEK